MAVLAGVVLICGYAVVQWTGRFDDGLGQAATPQPPPPGVVDPVNRGILIEAGTFISGSDDWEYRGERLGETQVPVGRLGADVRTGTFPHLRPERSG